ncbi:hypothetical protein GOODEAATRI_033215 [Goodea atripinnis]|uniref:Uncharacterized protein n=1 Tax=Goodea atripinnis TaxID=208336 RepID=A0ABV0N8J5_9TELE
MSLKFLKGKIGSNIGLIILPCELVGSVSLLLSGTWKPDGVLCPTPVPTPTPCYTSTPAAALEENRHSRPREDEEDRAHSHPYTPAEPAPPDSQTVVQSRIHLAHEAAAKPEGFSYAPKTNYPLLQQQGSGATGRYKPFSLGDITALCGKLPPISEGAAVWLQTSDTLTAGTTLALGDYRAVAGRCMPQHTCREIETAAFTSRALDSNLFT